MTSFRKMRRGIGKKRSRFLGCKKGNAILDSILVLVVLFAFILIVIIGKIIFDDTNDEIQSDANFDNSTKAIVQEQNTRYTTLFDGAFIFIFALVWILALVASFFIDTHPIFLVITVILLIIVFIIGAYLGNAYEEFSLEDDFSSVVPSFPMANWVMTHLLIVIGVVAFSIVLAMFAKSRYAQ